MSLLRSIRIAQAAAVIFVGAASAQFLHIGDADLQLADMTSGGKPTTLTISGLSDITNYAFDGSTLDVPFTLNGTGATVWLIVYTVDQNPPLTITGDGPSGAVGYPYDTYSPAAHASTFDAPFTPLRPLLNE